MSPPSLFAHIADVAAPFPALLLDAYGVFWAGGQVGVLPGAALAMQELVTAGKVIGILSNTTRLSHEEINQLETHGLKQGVHFHFFTTSGEIAKQLLEKQNLPFATPRNSFSFVGAPHPIHNSEVSILQNTPYQEAPTKEEADFFYVRTPHVDGQDQECPTAFQEMISQLPSHKPMFCPNPDHFAQEGSRTVVRQGTIAALYTRRGGVVHYVGKPHPLAYQHAMQPMEQKGITDPSTVLMVGDTPETDIRGAKAFGMQTALLTQTGLFAGLIQEKGWEYALSSLSPQDMPHFFVKRL